MREQLTFTPPIITCLVKDLVRRTTLRIAEPIDNAAELFFSFLEVIMIRTAESHKRGSAASDTPDHTS